jgi:hypothetical protein
MKQLLNNVKMMVLIFYGRQKTIPLFLQKHHLHPNFNWLAKGKQPGLFRRKNDFF